MLKKSIVILLLLATTIAIALNAAAQNRDALSVTLQLPMVAVRPDPPDEVTLVQVNNTPFNSCAVSDIASAGDGRLFVALLDGLVYIVDPDGSVRELPFLDISKSVSQRCGTANRSGLLSIVFHPDFANNGWLFVSYTRFADETLVISRFQLGELVSNRVNRVNRASEQVVMEIVRPDITAIAAPDSPVHNGGDLAFGRDGMLYIATGDGFIDPITAETSPGDPFNLAQSRDSASGKILRIDVDQNSTGSADCGAPSTLYTIPADNPFMDGAGGACDEVWAIGVRQPNGLAFNQSFGLVADDGQSIREEITVLTNGGLNLGWRCYEGRHTYKTDPVVAAGCDPLPHAGPVLEYDVADGCKIVGSDIYSGSSHALFNLYLFTDTCQNGWVGYLSTENFTQAGRISLTNSLPTTEFFHAGGRDSDGNIIFGTFSFNATGPVNIYRVESGSP